MKRSRFILFLFFLTLAAIGLAIVFAHAECSDFRWKRRGYVRIALCQYGTRLVNREGNFKNAMMKAEEAVLHDADVIVFPQFSFVSAYDLKHGHGWFNLEERTNWMAHLRSFTRRHQAYLFVNHPAVVFEADATNRYNQTQVFGPDGSVIATYRKRFLSVMDMLFGMKHGDQPTIVNLPFGKIGLMICKDSKHMEAFKEYAAADLILVQYAYLTFWGDSPSLSPGFGEPSRESLSTFARLVTNGIRHIRRPMLLCNKSGLEGECLYNGSSAIVDSSGRFIGQADTGTGILYADIPVNHAGRLSSIPVHTRFPAMRQPRRERFRNICNWLFGRPH